ncbi:MAG: PTS glucitol/sorbitol transporter subunit IIA [[Actinobacillus] rossii]|uniref:PTS system glucitol/sorbitol-specific transporter subunit IIA n=1 Tax=[Actinobacillus] rossii TaxID=123820 RepID=A0A380TNL3_9PAST|nr:PTS glucitol/sorbitol transporter subunit IIA [[Actinobacillus] rossii]MDD7426274.1 PTS glucitol/sorbitol transporter subunit IIA [[Actinobacillus] rossii]MDY3124582.1 PTS glucitol/sorbitol transporter subunit IIA [[Actinobacillus] rossii]MDY4505578.1 PTS glucitol/sorbitol transporter subunit IIA [[Actinobacillus] rossii]SUT88510.1 PTS system glucitol/sorbitol-specific transporter subunit IIA [[Actinobacillus] rossii]
MTIIYQTEFTKVGAFARDALAENMLITFKQGAPADLEDYCFIHSHGELISDLQVGDIAEFDGVAYPVTAVGDVASFNLKELGHVTWRFDGATTAEYPGTIHVLGEIPSAVKENSVLKIKRAE